MASSKIDRAKFGPSVVEVILGAFLSLLLGAVLAVCYLIVQPVQIGKTPDKEQPTSPVVYVKGNQDEDRSKQWLRKKQLFTESSSVEVNEDELNAWITAGTAPVPPKVADTKKPDPKDNGKKPDPKAKAKKPEPPPPPPVPAGPTEVLAFGSPNFRIENGVFQIGREGELNLDMVALKVPLVMQATGRFVKTADGFVFVPDQLFIGCCPLHKLPGAAGFVFEHLLAIEKIPQDVSAAWKKLAEVSVEGDSLKLTMP